MKDRLAEEWGRGGAWWAESKHGRAPSGPAAWMGERSREMVGKGLEVEGLEPRWESWARAKRPGLPQALLILLGVGCPVAHFHNSVAPAIIQFIV